MTDILDILTADYQRFPRDQTYSIYADDVYFKDPMTEFRGRDRYQQMIGFIQTWFREAHMEVHQIHRQGNQIRTDWTLTWITPLPWQPRIAITGWSELSLDADDRITAHVDYWHCSRWQVVRQHLPFATVASPPQ